MSMTWETLRLDAEVLFDAVQITQALEADMAQCDAGPDMQTAIVARLAAANQTGRDMIASALDVDPYATTDAISAYSYLTDQLVITALDFVTRHMHPNPNPTSAEQICLLAVGGCGRAEMAPFSDVDLLFLTPYKQTAWGESVIETVLYVLWDLKLKIGHSVRTVDECLRQGRSDYTTRTSLLERRYLAGQESMATELGGKLLSDLFTNTGPEFVKAKLEERDARHNRHGSSRYLLEPNIKEGKGGLRDLQTLYWIAKYLTHAETLQDLVDQGVFTEAEMAVFREAEAFLWTIRVHLHLLTGRASEQLTFDAQVELASVLGFEDSAGQRAVEVFMQTYFRHALKVGELTRVFIVSLEAEHITERPSLTRKILSMFSFGTQQQKEGFIINNGRLDVVDETVFTKDPVNILRLVDEGVKAGTRIHSNALRMVHSSLHLIDDNLRDDPEANRLLLSILLSEDDPIRGLRRLNELGILGAFMPDFGRIVAMMQFNMYHHYTVDEHIIQCLTNLFEIEQGKLAEDLPLATDILARGVNRRVMYVALLMHDIGKGREEDHSIIGAEIAARICPGLGIPQDECDTIEWLVRNHLVMSDFAQKRDLSDIRTIRDFAKIVQKPERLKLLCILTVCDIRGVGPNVWNNWKAALLRQLYSETLQVLTGDVEGQSRRQRINEAKAAFSSTIQSLDKDQAEAECDRHYDPFWLGLTTDTQIVFAELIREVAEDRPAFRLEPDEDKDATRACFAMYDHPGLFSRLAGALALAGANVVDGRTYTTSDGYVTAAFWIQDDDGSPYEAARLTRLQKVITRTLSGEVVAREAFRAKDKIKKRERDFIVPTAVSFDNEGSEIFTIIEVDTRDRPGLLYDLTRTLTNNGVSISSAIIATYGEQAVDSFYVKDLFGHKVHSESKRDQIAEQLKDAVIKGAQRADE